MQFKHVILLAAAILSFLVGAAGQYFYPGREISPVDLWAMPVFVFLMFWWYHIDSTWRSYQRTPWLNVGVIALAVVALPYYFFRSRGFKGGAVASFGFLVALIASGILTYGGQVATYYGLQS